MSNVSLSSPTSCAVTLPTYYFPNAPPSSTKKRSRSSSMTPTHRIRMNTDVTDALLDLVDQGRRRLEITSEIFRRDKLARPMLYSIDECMAKLERLLCVTHECILAAGETFKHEMNRWFFMHYERPLLKAWLQRQMINFYCVPSSMAAPFGSNVFFESAPNVFIPPPIHDLNQGGTHPFM